jgi:tryptophanyl-tRNA synthetase
VVEFLAPVREAYPEIRADEKGLEQILGKGAARAREIASTTLADVRAAMGVGVPPGAAGGGPQKR